MENLDINNLIEKAQEFVHDGKLDNAAYGKKPVQKLELSGNTFDLSLVAEAKYDKTKPTPESGGMYIVRTEDQHGHLDTTIGYWNGVEWERVRPIGSDKQKYSTEEYPTFQDMAKTVIQWKPINENW